MGKYDYETNLKSDIPFEKPTDVPQNKNNSYGLGYGVVIVIIIASLAYYSSLTKNINNKTSGDEANLVNSGDGSYSCTKFHSSKLKELGPSTILRSEVDDLESKQKRLKSEIDFMNPQDDVDLYNSKVNEYNSRNRIYKPKLEEFNRKIKEYNDYLTKNCKKR